jgi:hypothetical protein
MLKVFQIHDAFLKLGQQYATYLDVALQRAYDATTKLRREYATYLEKVSPFIYQNKTYHLINIFSPSVQIKCSICGNRFNPIVFVIENENGTRLKLGSRCIDHFAKMQVSKWYKNYKQKLENIIKNRKRIDGLSSLLNTCKKCELTCNIPFGEVEKLIAVLERICKGLDLNWKQETITNIYLDGRKKLCG